MTAIALHLSDIHIQTARDPILARSRNIASCVYSLLPEATVAFIIVSGDIAYSGKEEEYELAKKLLREIAQYINDEKPIPIHFIVCPGNHDCDFEKNTGVRRMALEGIVTKGFQAIDDSVVQVCCSIQESFFKFSEALNPDYSSAPVDRLWQTLNYEIEGKEIVFDCINVAWMSNISETIGSLDFPHQRYIKDAQDKPELRIAVMHHPMNWLSQRTYQLFRRALRTREHLIFTGHEHIGNFGENTDTESGRSAYVEGCVLQGEKDLTNSAFNLIELDLNADNWRCTRHKWDGGLYSVCEDGSWHDYRDIPIKVTNPFALEKSFLTTLSDPGANFKRLSGHQLSLSNIFVFPDLISKTNTQQPRQILSSQVLTDPIRLGGGILLEAEDGVGATSLLYQLFDHYYERGFVPILLSGEKLKGATARDIDAWIKNAVRSHYGEGAIEKFSQLEKPTKLLLLDDFGDCPVVSRVHLERVVEGIKERFGNIVVVVGDLFESREVITNFLDGENRSFHHYKILPFGYVLRSKLAKTWFSLTTKDGLTPETHFLSRCDQAEKLMEAAMVRNIVPSLPLYLLTLLQSIDVGLSGQFQESALGNYYFFLLNEGMKAAGIQPTKWDALTEYCSDLAWHFHNQHSQELPKHSLAEFNERFCKDRYTVDLDSQIGDLISSRILILNGDCYRFRYHYIYYLLKGRYLARELNSPSITAYVEHCCQHLYVRDNANTILFMAHQQAAQPYVMEKTISTLGALFENERPMTFSGDTKGVDKLVSELPKLEYSGEAPEKHRARVNNIRDQLDDGKDGLIEKEEGGKVLSVHAQFITAFKTVEILGQLLKNQFATLKRARRIEVLEHLFNGQLRALRGYFNLIEKSPESIISAIDSALRERANISDPDKRQRLAREIAAFIVHVTAFGFVYKVASSVSAESLIDDIRATAKNNDTVAFRLIELSAALETLKSLPKDRIEALIRRTKNDLVPHRLLQTMIVRHLYMFRTSERDKQWLSSKGVVNLQTQQVIEMKSKKIKKLQPRGK